MAKNNKKEVKQEPVFEIEYRLKQKHWRTKEQSIWKGCTLKAKQRLDKMYPDYYEYRDMPKAPEPTPNAIISEE